MKIDYQITDISVSNPLVDEFRGRVAADWGYPSSHAHQEFYRKDLPNDQGGEEVYKFSKKKWDKCGFDHLIGVILDNKLASVSGAKWYGGYLRVGMHYYTLKEYRNRVRSPLWSTGGMIDYLQTQLDGNNLFLTIYPHNNKLRAWVDKLRSNFNHGQLGRKTDDILYAFQVHDEPIEFNNVMQYIIYQPDVDIDKLINTLSGYQNG